MDLITATEAAEIFGITDSWAYKLAKRSNDKGFQWPVKKGNYWLAPKEEWEKILSPSDLQLRKTRQHGER